MRELVALARDLYLGVIVGAVASGVLQSSSVTIGIGIIMVQQGVLSSSEVVPIVVRTSARP